MIFGRFFSEKVPVQVHIKFLTSQNASRALPADSHGSCYCPVKRIDHWLVWGTGYKRSRFKSPAHSSHQLQEAEHSMRSTGGLWWPFVGACRCTNSGGKGVAVSLFSSSTQSQVWRILSSCSLHETRRWSAVLQIALGGGMTVLEGLIMSLESDGSIPTSV